MATSVRTVGLGSLAPGMNNKLEPTELDTKLADGKPAHLLAAAVNVTLNDKGYLKRREGKTLQIAGRCHSLWADKLGGFVVRNGDLCSVFSNTSGALVTNVVRQNVGGSRISYARGADGDVYWSNGSLLRRISQGQDRPVTTRTPSLTPVITLGDGALSAGTYLVATTCSGVDGESAASPVVSVQVPEGGAVNVLSGEVVNVYMSAANGDVLTYQGAGANYACVTHTDSGRRCDTLNKSPMPAGSIVRFHRGRLLVTTGNIICASEPYSFGLTDALKNWFPLPANIDMIESTDNGLYIAADQTYWIGDLFDDTLTTVLPYGAVPGTSGQSPDDTKVFWMSPRGLIIADNNMSVKNVQEANLDLGDASSGASIFRERDGSSHIVSSRVNVQQSTAAASSWMEAEIIRKGTVL